MPKTTVELPERLNLRLGPGDKRRLEVAARRRRLSVSAFVRMSALEAADRDLQPASGRPGRRAK